MYTPTSLGMQARLITADEEDAAATATSAVALTSRARRSLIEETERIGMSAPTGKEGLGRATELAPRLLENVETVVRGKSGEIKLVLAALVCGGHVLLEDVPGTAKTMLARAIAGSVDGATFSRIQCTPDL